MAQQPAAPPPPDKRRRRNSREFRRKPSLSSLMSADEDNTIPYSVRKLLELLSKRAQAFSRVFFWLKRPRRASRGGPL